jgi:hypothetical protein
MWAIKILKLHYTVHHLSTCAFLLMQSCLFRCLPPAQAPQRSRSSPLACSKYIAQFQKLTLSPGPQAHHHIITLPSSWRICCCRQTQQSGSADPSRAPGVEGALLSIDHAVAGPAAHQSPVSPHTPESFGQLQHEFHFIFPALPVQGAPASSSASLPSTCPPTARSGKHSQRIEACGSPGRSRSIRTHSRLQSRYALPRISSEPLHHAPHVPLPAVAAERLTRSNPCTSPYRPHSSLGSDMFALPPRGTDRSTGQPVFCPTTTKLR